MKFVSPIIVALLLLGGARAALAHGWTLTVDSATAPTTFNSITSNSPYLDLRSPASSTPAAAPPNVFLDSFGAVQQANGSYQANGGFGQIAGPQPPLTSATFTVLSPLYFSDGGGPATPASGSTTVHIFNRFVGSPTHVGASAGDVYLTGASSPPLGGFGVSLADTHELAKQLSLDPLSTQTSGEYGFLFSITATYPSGTFSTGPMLDVFATSNGGSPFSAASNYAAQDAATAAIYQAAFGVAVPEPPTAAMLVTAALCCVLGIAAVPRGSGGISK